MAGFLPFFLKKCMRQFIPKDEMALFRGTTLFDRGLMRSSLKRITAQPAAPFPERSAFGGKCKTQRARRLASTAGSLKQPQAHKTERMAFRISL